MKSAIQMIREIDRGQFGDDVQEAIDEVVEAIARKGRGSGSVTLKIDLKMVKEGVFEISGEVKNSKPKETRLPALFFFDDASNELVRNDPRQPTLPNVVRQIRNNEE